MEYSMIVMDNSDYSRNGDYVPTRWEAQIDAAFLISQAKINANQESAVGIITMAGNQPQVLLTPTNEDLKIKASLHGVKQNGKINLKKALSIAYLALKHRKNTNAGQRITVFVASPVAEDEESLVRLAKQFKKNKVAVDLLNLGEMDAEHVAKLEKFIETVNSGENSHFRSVEPGLGRIEDKIIGTPFMGADSFGGNEMQGGANNFGGDFGVGGDGDMDPELAEAIKLSMQTHEEEAKLRQGDEKDDNKMEEETKKEGNVGQQQGNSDKIEEEDLIQRAQNIVDNDEKKEKKQENLDESEIKDQDFTNELLGMVPGLKKDDQKIQEALQDIKKGDKDRKDDNDKKE